MRPWVWRRRRVATGKAPEFSGTPAPVGVWPHRPSPQGRHKRRHHLSGAGVPPGQGLQTPLRGERGYLVAQALQPVPAQAKACGYILHQSLRPAWQKTCRTLLHWPPFKRGEEDPGLKSLETPRPDGLTISHSGMGRFGSAGVEPFQVAQLDELFHLLRG